MLFRIIVLILFASIHLCMIFILSLSLVGCSQSKLEGEVITSTVEEGGIQLTLSRTQKELTTVDLLRLTVDVKAPQGSEFYFPNKNTDFGDFTYFESHLSSMKLNAENQVEQKFSIVLEPGLSGPHLLPPMEIVYGEKSILTELLKIEVKSILTSGKSEVKDIIPLTAPAGFMGILILGIMISIVLLDAALLKQDKVGEEISYSEQAMEKINSAELADIPKIFCEFLTLKFKDHVSYTGTESLMKYLSRQSLKESLLNDIEKSLRNYEKVRFASQGSQSTEPLMEVFSGLILKLEEKP